MSDDQLEIVTASLTNVGLVRTKNQDSCGEFQRPDGTHLLVVADGMGGHRGGEVASAAAIQIIGRHFENGVGDPVEFLGQAFGAANDEILRLATEDPKLSRMGTTGVAVLILPDRSAFVANVGDSRAYRLRDGKLSPITADHSWVAEQVRAGRMSEEEAEDHPRRNVLSRCIGIQPLMEVDIDAVDIQPGDQFLLCSDGLWGLVPPSQIVEILEHQDAELAASQLIALANERGGQDNITVQIARFPSTTPREDTARLSASSPDATLELPAIDVPDAPPRSMLLPFAIGAALLLLGAALLWSGAIESPFAQPSALADPRGIER